MAAQSKVKLTIEVDAKTKARIERITNPRDHRLSLLFRKGDVDRWKALAEARGDSLTSLIEQTMNAFVTTTEAIEPKRKARP